MSAAFLVLAAAAPLDPALADAAIAAAGGGPVVTLGPEAAEAGLPDADPARLARARAAIGAAPVDVNMVPAAGRAKRLLIADMDSTMIGCECIDEIADWLGIKPRIAAITEAAMRGEIGFEASLTERVALLKDLPEAALAEVHAARVRLNPGAEILVRSMAAIGADTALVSGGFTFFSARVAAQAGFASHAANRLEVAAGKLTGRVIPPILGREAKAEKLAALCKAGGYGPADVLAIGDGANDLAMIAVAGLGVAYRAKPAVAEAADASLDHADLTAVLHLQGIARARWCDQDAAKPA